MHFSYLDETGCTGVNLADAEQPVFVLGGVSVTDEAWRTTTERFNSALDNFFGGARPAGAELHACNLITCQGIFAGRAQEECNALAHLYLDIIAERGHAIHFIGIDKARLAARVAGAPEAFFDLTVPYLLGFNYLVSYIERHTKENLGQSARAMVIIDPKEEYHAQIDAITLSFPKIPSGWIRIVRQNHRILESDVCDPARAWNVRRRPVQVAMQA